MILLESHRQEWTRDVEAVIPAEDRGNYQLLFRRGFVEGLDCSPEFFASHAAEMVQIAPIRCLSLDTRNSPLRATLSCPELEKIEELAVGWIELEDLKQLVETSYLVRLSRLRLLGRLGDDGVKLIVSAPWVCNLQHLSLNETWIGDEGMVSLANCPRLE